MKYLQYISGTGMTPATRRRVTAYEDESDIMPEPRPFRVTEVVKILHAADPVEQFHQDVANSRLNVSANEISTFQWQNPANGVRVETQVSLLARFLFSSFPLSFFFSFPLIMI